MVCNLKKVKEDFGAVVADIDSGGGRSEGVGKVFKAVKQAVLLFGAETWVLTPSMERAMCSFQHRFA